jgi:hypothetical protein
MASTSCLHNGQSWVTIFSEVDVNENESSGPIYLIGRVRVFLDLTGSTCYPLYTMADEHANTDSAINEVVRILKLKIPPEDHAALDSRVQELINDPSTDDDDVISILRDEFDPA